MSTREPLRLATRGSQLARWQAERVKRQLETRRRPVELVEVETTGDQLRDELIHRLGTTGAFVRSLDEKVLAGEVDGAVHSMKDMPTDSPPELVVAAIPERGPPGDVLVTPDGAGLADLPEAATVGTSSLRRGAQLQAERPDLEITPLRGNVDTRVEKLLAPHRQREHERRIASEADDAESNETEDRDGEAEVFERTVQEWLDERTAIERRALERDTEREYDAICLAEAGLERTGLLADLAYERLEPTRFVPAPAQGAIAVTALDGETAEYIHNAVDHPPTRVETTVERTILATIGGGCVAPIGVLARLQGEVVATTVRVLSRDGTETVASSRELPVERHAETAAALAADLVTDGAADLVEAARRETPDGPKREEP